MPLMPGIWMSSRAMSTGCAASTADRLVAVAARGDEFEFGLFRDQPRQSLARQLLVFDHQNSKSSHVRLQCRCSVAPVG